MAEACDLIIRRARLAGKAEPVDLACAAGKIAAVEPAYEGQARSEIDAAGRLVIPPFVDPHFHLDAALSYGRPRISRSGTLLEGIDLWRELKQLQTREEVVARALEMARWSAAQGVQALRSHVDVSGPSFAHVEALLEVREAISPAIDLQLVAFPQDGYLRAPQAAGLLDRALDMGVDIVGGIPHFERTTDAGAESVRLLCRIAAQRGLRVDMHCDETDDPHSRHIETLAEQAIEHGLQGRVAGSHLASMHSMDNYYVSKLLPLIAEAQVAAIPNPLINISLQGRRDSYPKRRGLTRIDQLWEHGITVALGHDCVMDPWYALGTHDMLEVASMAAHVGLLTAPAQLERLFDAVTYAGAEVMGLQGYGLEPGCNADMVVLQASDRIEAIRTRAPRLWAIRRGRVIAQREAAASEVQIGEGKPERVDFIRRAGHPQPSGSE